MEYLRNIYNTIILKDVVNRYSIRNVRQLQDLTVYLADTIGNLFSANKISEYLKSQRGRYVAQNNIGISYLFE